MARIKFYSLLLSLICIIVFILQLMLPSFENLFILNQEAFWQVWRFLTSIFLHSSLSHLILNLFGLIFFGLVLEKTIGSNKMLGVFFISGIIANIVSIFFYPASLGASGAIFGLIGCLAVLRPLMPVWAFGLILPMSIAALAWMTGDILRGLYVNDNIGHLAHISGIIFGFFIGIILKLKMDIKNGLNSDKINIPDYKMRRWEDRFMKD